MALNDTQIRIINSVLSTYIKDILELDLTEVQYAFNKVFEKNISLEDKTLFKEQNIWADVRLIHDIIFHPNPQNRIGSTLDFISSDSHAIVYKDSDGKPQSRRLGLNAWNDPNTSSVTREDVVQYIHQLINAAVEQKKTDKPSHPSAGYKLFKEDNKVELLKQIKTQVTDEELALCDIPIRSLARLPAPLRNSFCQLVQEYRPKPDPESDDDFYFGLENQFIGQLSGLLSRGVSLEKFLSMDKSKQISLTVDHAVWRLVEIGISFDKLAQLESEELKRIFAWLSENPLKAMVMNRPDQRQAIAEEIDQFIDDALDTGPTPD